MNRSYRRFAITALCSAAFFQLMAAPSPAAIGDVLATLPFYSYDLVRDPNRPYIYASDIVGNSIKVIDTNTLSVVHSITVSQPWDLAIAADGKTLYAAQDRRVSVIDTESFSLTRSIPVSNRRVYEVEVGLDNRLYLLTVGDLLPFQIEQIDALTGNATGTSVRVDIGFLSISPDRSKLYCGESASSSASLTKFDVSTTVITKLKEMDVGEYGVRSVLSHDGTMIVQPAQVPQTQLRIYKTDDLTVKGNLATQRPAESAAFSPDDSIAYVANSSAQGPRITMFNTTTFQPDTSFPIADNGYSMRTNATGDRLFAGFQSPNRTVVYLVPEPPSALIALTVAMILTLGKFIAVRARSTP
jgi:YVTN family beta-propeller protein